ncbi:MAG: hypothetical protein AAGL89_18105 [Pseudomonadota bacterium]
MKSMILASVVAAALALPAAAQQAATMTVTGAVNGDFSMETSRNTLFEDEAGAYFAAEIYAEGVDAGVTQCQDIRTGEVDYFFGDGTGFGGHILVTLEQNGGVYRLNDPTIFFDDLDADGELVDTYANFDTVQMTILEAECRSDEALTMTVAYKAQLLSGFGGGPGAVNVSGTARADLILRDMNEY